MEVPDSLNELVLTVRKWQPPVGSDLHQFLVLRRSHPGFCIECIHQIVSTARLIRPGVGVAAGAGAERHPG